MSTKFAVRLAVCFGLVTVFSLMSAAQQTPPPGAAPSAQTQPTAQGQTAPSSQQSPPNNDPGKDPIKDNSGQATNRQGAVPGTSNDRLFFTLPNFLTLENTGKLPPLTTGQKFAVVARSSFDYVQYPWYGFLAGISQWENSEPGYGQGAAGYGRRFGASMADGTIENFTTSAVFPSLLHQDPRFYQSGRGGFLRRTGYAMSRIILTRSDDGHAQFNFSEILGSSSAAAISTYSYHPKGRFVSTPAGPKYIPSDRTLKNTANVWGSEVGYDTLTYVVKEFWPDIRRMLRGKRKREAVATPTP